MGVSKISARFACHFAPPPPDPDQYSDTANPHDCAYICRFEKKNTNIEIKYKINLE